MGQPFPSGLHNDCSNNNQFSQLRSPDDLGRKPLGPGFVRNSGETLGSVRRITRRKQAENSWHPKSIEVMLRKTARKSYPENVDSPMIAPQEYEVF